MLGASKVQCHCMCMFVRMHVCMVTCTRVYLGDGGGSRHLRRLQLADATASEALDALRRALAAGPALRRGDQQRASARARPGCTCAAEQQTHRTIHVVPQLSLELALYSGHGLPVFSAVGLLVVVSASPCGPAHTVMMLFPPSTFCCCSILKKIRSPWIAFGAPPWSSV